MEISQVLGKTRYNKGYQLCLYIHPDQAQAFADALFYLLQTNPLISKSAWITIAVLKYAEHLSQSTPPPMQA